MAAGLRPINTRAWLEPPAPFALGLRVALLAIAVPLAVLALGTPLLWATAGFMPERG